jgi:hypothetical protein
MLGRGRLSLAKENVTFPRMNYRRKNFSMKERLEEAIEEIGDEPLQGPGFERETAEEGFSKIEPEDGRMKVRRYWYGRNKEVRKPRL